MDGNGPAFFIIQKYDDLELYQKIIDLRDEIFKLREENLSLRERVKELGGILNVKQQMTFKKPFYYQEGDIHPYCPKCWEADKKALHLDGPLSTGAGSRYDCPNCEKTFYHPRHEFNPQAERDYSPF